MKKWAVNTLMLVLVLSLLACQNGLSEDEAKKLVEEFGGRLLEVSLLAPKDVLSESMKESYGDFVTPDLLERWSQNPEDAPGRWVSSPWPDRIEVTGTEALGDGGFLVTGEIVYIAGSEEMPDRAPISFRVRKDGEKPLIYDVVWEDCEPKIFYKNEEYGFLFELPETWVSFEVLEETWDGVSSDEILESGPLIVIRHPMWEEDAMRQDIPIMVFSLTQWDALSDEEFSVGAAPVGPKELNRNDRYVFALPARYNYAFLEGYEEVETILSLDPLRIMPEQ